MTPKADRCLQEKKSQINITNEQFNKNFQQGAGAMASPVGPPFITQVILFQSQATLLLMRVPVNRPEKPSDDAPSAWTPATPGRNLHGVCGSQLHPGPGVALEAISVNYQTEKPIFLSSFLCLLFLNSSDVLSFK